MTHIIAWGCIGLALGLAACIWPFRRGYLGVALNLGAAFLGAAVAPSLGVVLGLSTRDPRDLALAACGAALALLLVHAVWYQATTRTARAQRR